MRFCDKCGSRMIEEKKGFSCPKCGIFVLADSHSRSRDAIKIEQCDSLYIINKKQDDQAKVSQTCPECGHGEAFHWFSRVAGEHAGIGTERTIEHFKCSKCLHSWNTSS